MCNICLKTGKFLGGCAFCHKRGLGWNMKTGEAFVQKALGWNGVSLRFTEASLTAAQLALTVGRGCPLKGWYRLIADIQQRKANDIIRPVTVVHD
jgi:hypothetical protein